jgi:hypothetical protein
MTLTASTHTPASRTAQPQETDPLIPRRDTDGTNSTSPPIVGLWANFRSMTKDVYRRNVGLSLIVGAQGFFALMNLAVKKLNSIDPPVSALEVR